MSILIDVMLYCSMVTLRGRPVGSSGAGEGSASGSRASQLGEQMTKFISAEITRSILDQTPLIFGTVKEGILELLDSRLKDFRVEIATGQLGAPLGPSVYRSLGSVGREYPVISSCSQGSEVGYAPCLQESPFQEWIDVEVSRAVRKKLPDIVERVNSKVTARVQV